MFHVPCRPSCAAAWPAPPNNNNYFTQGPLRLTQQVDSLRRGLLPPLWGEGFASLPSDSCPSQSQPSRPIPSGHYILEYGRPGNLSVVFRSCPWRVGGRVWVRRGASGCVWADLRASGHAPAVPVRCPYGARAVPVRCPLRCPLAGLAQLENVRAIKVL